jgi:hypothetical protein
MKELFWGGLIVGIIALFVRFISYLMIIDYARYIFAGGFIVVISWFTGTVAVEFWRIFRSGK